ncbi:MAG: hypothetical protein ABJF09_00635 [Qipengyuania citrea]|uniref:hypothetical protein n=2 Tax=Qipengyuania citrea TaxID=225971 RepID=UPI003266B93D
MIQLHPHELPEALQMDERSNYKPTTIHRDPPGLPWRKLLLGCALALGLAFVAGYAAHALLDWLDIPHAELGE